jgi:hypothetical protein
LLEGCVVIVGTTTEPVSVKETGTCKGELLPVPLGAVMIMLPV